MSEFLNHLKEQLQRARTAENVPHVTYECNGHVDVEYVTANTWGQYFAVTTENVPTRIAEINAQMKRDETVRRHECYAPNLSFFRLPTLRTAVTTTVTSSAYNAATGATASVAVAAAGSATGAVFSTLTVAAMNPVIGGTFIVAAGAYNHVKERYQVVTEYWHVTSHKCSHCTSHNTHVDMTDVINDLKYDIALEEAAMRAQQEAANAATKVANSTNTAANSATKAANSTTTSATKVVNATKAVNAATKVANSTTTAATKAVNAATKVANSATKAAKSTTVAKPTSIHFGATSPAPPTAASNEYSTNNINSGSTALPVPLGLVNLGNTCYMNAAIQVLLAVPTFIPSVKRDFCDYQLTCDLILKIADSSSSSSDRKENIEYLKNKMGDRNSQFKYNDQGDAYEFLNTLIMSIHDETGNIGEVGGDEEMLGNLEESDDDNAAWTLWARSNRRSSIAHSIFSGQTKTVRTCKMCDTRSRIFDHFVDLTLPLGEGTDTTVCIEHLLDCFMGEELLSVQSSSVTCSKCNTQTDAVQRTSIQVWPQSLVLHLGRLTSTGGKLNSLVQYGVSLKVKPEWGGGGASSQSAQGEPPQYTLTGVIVHTGRTMNEGHFTAYVKAGSAWYLCNDDSVRMSSMCDVLKQQQGAYVLLYSNEGNS